MFCYNTFKQLSFDKQLSELNKLVSGQPVDFLELLKNHFDLSKFISEHFQNHYYSSLGRNRKIYLTSILALLLFGHLFRISTTKTLLLILYMSPYLKEFCQFDNTLPDETFISRFKTTFTTELNDFFENLSNHTMSLCSEVDSELPTDSNLKGFSSMLIYDTSGLKPKVKENNPKTTQNTIDRYKNYAKVINNPDYNPYAAAYKSLPKQSSTNPEIKLDYVNGHYGYFYKFGILSNGLGLPLKLHFFDDNFYQSLDDKFESFEDQKYSFDNASLKPVLSSFFPSGNSSFDTFIADSEFDSYDNFALIKSFGFSKAFIPINPRNSNPDSSSVIPTNFEGTPICPKDKTEFIPQGICKGKKRSIRFKYICPKALRIKGTNKYTHTCEEPCRQTNSAVTTYKYPHKNFRFYPGVQRNSDEWIDIYRKRTVIERELAYLKSNSALSSPNTTNTATMRSDLLLAASAKLIIVILAYAINKPNFIKNIRYCKTIKNVLEFIA